MNVSAGVQRPVLDGAGRNAGRRILRDDVTVTPAAWATPPNYPAASALVFRDVFGIWSAAWPAHLFLAPLLGRSGLPFVMSRATNARGIGLFECASLVQVCSRVELDLVAFCVPRAW
jgi:hypothetical protein